MFSVTSSQIHRDTGPPCPCQGEPCLSQVLTSRAVFWQAHSEAGRAKHWRIVVPVQDGDGERNTAVQSANVFTDQEQLHSWIREGFPVQHGTLTDRYHGYSGETARCDRDQISFLLHPKLNHNEVFFISIRECDVLKGLNAMFQKRISPVVGLMVKRSTLGPIRPYFTTAFGPISLSVAKTGPFRISTVVPGRQRDRSCFVHSYLQLFFRVMVDPKPMLGKPDTRWEYTKKDH